MTRDTLIRVHRHERDALDEVRDEMYGSDAVPYGEVIGGLTEYYVENEIEDDTDEE